VIRVGFKQSDCLTSERKKIKKFSNKFGNEKIKDLSLQPQKQKAKFFKKMKG
jgi:hypothetical protein